MTEVAPSAAGAPGGGDPRLVRCGYAKLQGDGIEFFMRRYEITMGRTSKNSTLDLILGDTTTISRQHASIRYNFDAKQFELVVLGKNGVTVESSGDGTTHLYTPESPPTPLRSRDLLIMGEKKFYFLLPRGPGGGSRKRRRVGEPSPAPGPAMAMPGPAGPGPSSSSMAPMPGAPSQTIPTHPSVAAAAPAPAVPHSHGPQGPPGGVPVGTVGSIPVGSFPVPQHHPVTLTHQPPGVVLAPHLGAPHLGGTASPALVAQMQAQLLQQHHQQQLYAAQAAAAAAARAAAPGVVAAAAPPAPQAPPPQQALAPAPAQLFQQPPDDDDALINAAPMEYDNGAPYGAAFGNNGFAGGF